MHKCAQISEWSPVPWLVQPLLGTLVIEQPLSGQAYLSLSISSGHLLTSENIYGNGVLWNES